MANHKSAIKRHKQSEKRRVRNTAVKSAIKTAIKTLETTAQSGDTANTEAALKSVTSLLDKAVTKGVFHKNKAARKISRLTSATNATLGSAG